MGRGHMGGAEVTWGGVTRVGLRSHGEGSHGWG